MDVGPLLRRSLPVACWLTAVMFVAVGCTTGDQSGKGGVGSAPSTGQAATGSTRGGTACQRAGSLCRPIRSTGAASSCQASLPAHQAFGRQVLGPGPVYPVTPSGGPIIAFNASDFNQSADGVAWPHGPWHPQKVLWLASAHYSDGFLLRVVAVGHSGRARLELPGAAGSFADIVYLPAPSQPPNGGVFDYPSTTAVSAPGCYAWQVDGDNFSYLIYFTAVLHG